MKRMPQSQKRAWAAGCLLFVLGCGVGCGVGFEGVDGASTAGGAGPAGGGGAIGGGGAGGVGGVGGNGSGGSTVGDLVDEGLLVRYFMNEGSTGPATGVLLDAGPYGVNLPLSPGDNVTWTSNVSGNGLHWLSAESGGMAIANTVGASALMALDTASQLTIEMVMGPLSSSPSNGARVFHVGSDMNGELALSLTDAHEPELRIGGNSVVTWPVDLSSGRRVWHLMLDLGAPAPNDAVRLYLDGIQVTGAVFAVTPPAQLSVPSDGPFVVGNRIPANRAPAGDILYLAIYERVLNSAEIATNATRLDANDD